MIAYKEMLKASTEMHRTKAYRSHRARWTKFVATGMVMLTLTFTAYLQEQHVQNHRFLPSNSQKATLLECENMVDDATVLSENKDLGKARLNNRETTIYAMIIALSEMEIIALSENPSNKLRREYMYIKFITSQQQNIRKQLHQQSLLVDYVMNYESGARFHDCTNRSEYHKKLLRSMEETVGVFSTYGEDWMIALDFYIEKLSKQEKFFVVREKNLKWDGSYTLHSNDDASGIYKFIQHKKCTGIYKQIRFVAKHKPEYELQYKGKLSILMSRKSKKYYVAKGETWMVGHKSKSGVIATKDEVMNPFHLTLKQFKVQHAPPARPHPKAFMVGRK